MKTSVRFTACLFVVVILGCSDEGTATGSLLLNTLSPRGIDPPCCAPVAVSVRYELSCETELGPEVARGDLEFVDENESHVLWESLLEGIPPGDCTLTLVARDRSDEVHCTATESVAILAGSIQEPQVLLVCNLSFGPRSDLTEEERRACIDAGSPCFSDGDDSF